MISLQEHLYFLIEFKNLAEVDSILESVSPKITFWGKRVLKARGYSGSIAIDKVTEKILKEPVGGSRRQVGAQSLIRDKVINKLDGLYTQTDLMVENLNCISRCLVSSRNSRKLRTDVEGQYFPLT